VETGISANGGSSVVVQPAALAGASLRRRHRASLRVTLASLAIAALSFGVAPSFATTAPNVVNKVRVVLTNTSIEIPKDQFVLANGITRYPRGATIIFILYNEATKPLSVELATASGSSVVHISFLKLSHVKSAGAAIAPGEVRNFKASFDFRGTFVMETLHDGKIVYRRPIIIF
jgi:hypothetical protein